MYMSSKLRKILKFNKLLLINKYSESCCKRIHMSSKFKFHSSHSRILKVLLVLISTHHKIQSPRTIHSKRNLQVQSHNINYPRASRTAPRHMSECKKIFLFSPSKLGLSPLLFFTSKKKDTLPS